MYYLFPLVMLVLRLPSLSRPPGETLAPEDIEMDSMTFSMEDVSSEDPKVSWINICIKLYWSPSHIMSYWIEGCISTHVYIYTYVYIFLKIGFIWKTSTLTSIFLNKYWWISKCIWKLPKWTQFFQQELRSSYVFFVCEKGQFESALPDGWWCWCWILVVRKFQFYPFFHNHGSGKLPQMKGNHYWRDPIFHFHDGGKDNLCLLNCAIYCQPRQPLDRLVCLAGCHHWWNFTTSSSAA